jgi:hypothetical protein
VSEGIYEQVAEIIAAEPWPSEARPEDRWIGIPIDGTGDRRFLLVVQALEDREQVVVYGLVPAVAPEDRRAAAALLIARINWGMVLGNFEQDLDDGELRFKVALDPGGQPVTAELLRPLLQVAAAMVDRYAPAFDAVVEGADPPDALAAVQA